MNEKQFRPLRRNKQQLTDLETRNILRRTTSGVLALSGDYGYPYAVPLSFVLHNDILYFHSAVIGHKIESISNCEKASFCVIEQDNVLAEKFTTAYRSVIAFGKIGLVENSDERLLALKLLTDKYSPQVSEANVNKVIESGLNKTAILRFEIEHLTGKQGRQTMENGS